MSERSDTPVKGALSGTHLCLKHQGNYSHYAKDNCEICTLERELSALTAQLAEARRDAERLDFVDNQWRDGIHVEVCATGGPTVHGLRPAATVYFGKSEMTGGTVRDAIDAAIQESKK